MRSSATLMLVVFAAILLGVAGSAIATSNSGHEALQACIPCQEQHLVWTYSYRTGTYTWAYAYVEGWVCTPSDGNIYGVYRYWAIGKRPGAPDVPAISVTINSFYRELGCQGDEAGIGVTTYVDLDGDGQSDLVDAQAVAWIKAASCCSPAYS